MDTANNIRSKSPPLPIPISVHQRSRSLGGNSVWSPLNGAASSLGFSPPGFNTRKLDVNSPPLSTPPFSRRFSESLGMTVGNSSPASPVFTFQDPLLGFGVPTTATSCALPKDDEIRGRRHRSNSIASIFPIPKVSSFPNRSPISPLTPASPYIDQTANSPPAGEKNHRASSAGFDSIKEDEPETPPRPPSPMKNCILTGQFLD